MLGQTTALSPSSGGTWTSTNYAVASVDDAGIVTAFGAGTAAFIFRDNATGCYSDPTSDIFVNPNDAAEISGDDQICMGVSSSLSANASGGTWSSSDNSIGMIDANSGEITPITPGSIVITYTPPPFGCYATETYNVNIYDTPTVSFNGPSTICEGSITYVSASTSGTWTSSDESVAIVLVLVK